MGWVLLSPPVPRQSRIGDLFAPANSLMYNIPTSNCFAALATISKVSQSDTLSVDQSEVSIPSLREDAENAGLAGNMLNKLSFLTAKAVKKYLCTLYSYNLVQLGIATTGALKA